ncbi:MAG TPA: hypothetical protein VG838_11250 [Opitutaceae bacterium]|nr:hypothetical protein [Opitutaceae bacterium]
MTRTAPALAFALAALLSPALRAGFTNEVAVSSTSTAEYARQKFGPGAPKPESYLFFQGKFFGGATKDSNLEHAQFGAIAKTLAENLVRQNYFPTRDQKNADLLIVVHWGVTTVYEDPNRELNVERKSQELTKYNDAVAAAAAPSDDFLAHLAPDQGPLNNELALADLEQMVTENSIAGNAQLLGFRQELRRAQNQGSAASNGASDDEMKLQLLLAEERYFVILMAYDYHTMKKGTKPKLLWSTRFSITSRGDSFTKALPAMSRAAGDYFGRALDGLKFEAPDVPKGKVDVGTPKVLEDRK